MQAADDGDREEIECHCHADGVRVNVSVPPDVDHAGERRDERPDAERQHPVERDIVAKRAHPHGLIAHALKHAPERRPQHVSDQDVNGKRDDQRRVVEAEGVHLRKPDQVRRVDPADTSEAGESDHLAEEVVRDHRVRERDHQEVDASAPARKGAQEKAKQRRDPDPDQGTEPGVPTEIEAIALARGDHVPKREPGDAVERDLRERDHAAVCRKEDETRRRDPEPECLSEDEADEERAEEQRREDGDEDHTAHDHLLEARQGSEPVHAGRPKSP